MTDEASCFDNDKTTTMSTTKILMWKTAPVTTGAFKEIEPEVYPRLTAPTAAQQRQAEALAAYSALLSRWNEMRAKYKRGEIPQSEMMDMDAAVDYGEEHYARVLAETTPRKATQLELQRLTA